MYAVECNSNPMSCTGGHTGGHWRSCDDVYVQMTDKTKNLILLAWQRQ